MQIARTFTVPIDASTALQNSPKLTQCCTSLRDTKLIANKSDDLSFSTLMQGIIDDKTNPTQEAATQKQSDSSCDSDKSLNPCKCDSDKETEEVTEAKKSGIAACMDCSFRKSGQCDMWNGEDENGAFDLFSVTSNNSATQANVAKILDTQTHLDVISKASSDYDYTYAYTYLRKKIKNINFG